MGSSSSKSDNEDEKEFNERPEVAPPPEEPRTEPDIVENIESALAYDFSMGVSSNFDDVKTAILGRSEEAGKPYVYRDTDFPADSSSVYFSSRHSSQWDGIKWKRPYDISSNPRLLTDGIAKEDILQGSLGNCWWLSSVAAISRNSRYTRKIIPDGQTLSGSGYVGMFHFRFWRFGSWVDVVIDDRLPTYGGRLIFGHSSDHDEFWLPFLEKAYAKLHGSYQAIEGGFTMDGLEDLTGGLACHFSLGDSTPKDLYRKLLKSFRNKSFVCASITGSGEDVDRNTGLVSAHAYTMTDARRIPFRGTQVDLVRIRNPWGNKVEWKGDWSDSSYLWREVNKSVRDEIGYTDEDNGEWWMSYHDFTYYFSGVTICTLGPDFDEDGAPTGDRWLLSMAKGEWRRRYTAGGSRNDVKSYATNPQYHLELREPDEFDPAYDDPETQGKCSIVIGLMQEYRRIGRDKGLQNLSLGLNVFRMKEKPRRKLSYDYFRYHREIASSGTYTNFREVQITAELPPGHYVIVPSTFNRDESGSFLLRMFTEKRINLEELF